MYHLRIGCSLALVLLPGLTVSAQEQPPEFAALFCLSFDDSVQALAEGTEVTVTGGEELGYAEGKVGKAADFLKGGCLEYRDLPAFDLKQGTIELWIKSPHDGKEMEDHYYLQFLKEDGSAGIEIKFYHVECSVQVRMWGSTGKFRRYGWGWAQDAWQQIVVSWNSTDPNLSGLGLYKQGIETGYPRPYKPIEMPDFLRVGCKSPEEEGEFAKALIDEVVVYNRSLTRGQAKALFENGGKPLEEKVAALRERIARDEAIQRERTDLLFNHRKLGMLHGRYQSLVHWQDAAFTPLQIPVPDKVHETELATTDLGQYDALFVAGGGGLRLDDANAEALRKYVREGGGYVGICGGAVSACNAGLIEAERFNFGVRGPVWNKLEEHPITEGYDLKRKLLFPHASGPLFVVKEDSGEVPVVIFDVGNPPLPTFVNTIAKEYGEGRVVAFSGHPEGSAQTRRLFRNAIMWAAKITGTEDQTAEPE